MAIKLATVNVNGIRAAFRKGMAEWVNSSGADIIALQEVRAETKDLADLFAETGEWHILHDAASAKGRAGAALVSKVAATATRTDFGSDDFDSAGRWLEADYDFDGKKLTVVSTYVHSGEVDTPKQVEKYKFLDAMVARMAELKASGADVVIVGDLNVGHTELDIKNWKGNLKNAGFLPEERAYFDTMMNDQGWVDVGRAAHPGIAGPYTWWSYRGQAFDTDAGWRIDYHLATPGLAAKAENYQVHRAASYDTRWTDHTPVVVDYAI
ncbi:exodeoxyribonuclease III [Rhodoluna sp.]|uniref:exodeoxyribonuclease III n=1 Tax=Rhodoluna sp. TaxID=1969481 RepID=UPI0025E04EE2|nr:exodeoxyribonuclease III [Rhodoluna sp.]